MPLIQKCESCGADAELLSACGAYVCIECEHHNGLARCFCGWAADGGDGYQHLLEAGEQIEDDY